MGLVRLNLYAQIMKRRDSSLHCRPAPMTDPACRHRQPFVSHLWRKGLTLLTASTSIKSSKRSKTWGSWTRGPPHPILLCKGLHWCLVTCSGGQGLGLATEVRKKLQTERAQGRKGESLSKFVFL